MRAAPDRGPLSEINVTPLVDVFLVLLVIFMITAPVLKTALEVGLPQSESGTRRGDRGLTVELRRDGQLVLGREPVRAQDLGWRLLAEALPLAGGDSVGARRLPVFLAADERVSYGEVVALLDRIREAGFEDVGLMTDPPDHSRRP
ncbi:MAG: biopolymer transporter ExbD [bacterium]|jgi:biopolymer transport protein TolR|nr:biopolymer transporter ExbD [bacterium]